MENRISIETAQNVIIEHHLANLGERIVAYLVDGLIQTAYIILVVLIFTFVEPKEEELIWTMVVLLAIPFTFYHLAMEAFFHGQSVGKMVMKIRVVKMDGSEVSVVSYFLRWLLRLVDIAAFSGAVAIISIIAGGKGQRIGDIVAGTTVVSTKPRSTMADTFPTAVDENYDLKFPEVALLTDEDINTIKDVMFFVQKNQTEHAVNMAYRTKQALEEKMGISSDMMAKPFFEKLLKDYAYYHTSLDGEW